MRHESIRFRGRWPAARLAILIPVVFLPAAFPAAGAQQTEELSLNSVGESANGHSLAYSLHKPSLSVSDDGTRVAFISSATNLTGFDTNHADDVFVRDRTSELTLRASVSSAGLQGDRQSAFPAISGDGRWVAFESRATNLVPNDTNAGPNWEYDIFVHDLQTRVTTRESLGPGGVQVFGSSNGASLSTDGRFLAFHSWASGLVVGDNNGRSDVFVRDRLTGVTERVSVSSTGLEANHNSRESWLSADGRWVAFESLASNLVVGTASQRGRIYLHDRVSGNTALVSRSSSGAPAETHCFRPVLSQDGRWVAFWSLSSNLVLDDTNGLFDAFVHDRITRTTTRVSLGSAGQQGQDSSYSPSLSADGRYVTFFSSADNLVPGDLNGHMDVFRRDLVTGELLRASVDGLGREGDLDSLKPAISADGRTVVFESQATNLRPGPVNYLFDVFGRDFPPDEVSTYCTAKVNSLGCRPAMASFGVARASAGFGFEVSAERLLNRRVGIFLHGTSGRLTIPFHGAFLCARPPLLRTALVDTGGSARPVLDCSGRAWIDFNARIASGRDPALTAGRTVQVQFLGRDPGSPSGTSLSNALEFTIHP